MSVFQMTDTHEIFNVQELKDRLAALHVADDIRQLRQTYLGKKSAIKAALKNLHTIPTEERPARARQLQELEAQVEALLSEAETKIETRELTKRLLAERQDPFLPGILTRQGSRHPVHEVELRCLKVLRQFGFELADGPEVESPYNNFDALNIPEHHPARDMQDTFWIDGGLLLRSHTTTIQARILKEGRSLPLKIAAAGRVYRNEAVDATHLAMFHQLEGFWLDHGVNFAQLKGLLTATARALYGEKTKLRVKPKFYPYTEPSVGLDIACTNCDGEGCEACHHQGWVTIMGAGMIHRNVLREFGYDRPGVSGFAFGWGTTRMTAQWLGLDRVRSLYQADDRFFRALKKTQRL
jgi:phenylalanyl-tRNA synthetase alpha chain